MTRAKGSLAARWTVSILRRFIKPRLEMVMRAARRLQELLARYSPERRAPFAPEIAGEWTPAQGDPVATLFFLHGGGIQIGSPRMFRFVSRRFARAGFEVFMPAYRLAPEYVYPAALDDVCTAYRALAAARPGGVVIAGDSAGGGLALSLMLKLREEGRRLPVAAALFSPWTDLAATGPSTRENEGDDPFFTRRAILFGARTVLGKSSARNPLASPVFADLADLPPMLVHVGAGEALRDDSTRLVERARAAGVEAEIEIWPDVPHAWQLMGLLPEARQSREKAIDFLKEKARPFA